MEDPCIVVVITGNILWLINKILHPAKTCGRILNNDDDHDDLRELPVYFYAKCTVLLTNCIVLL